MEISDKDCVNADNDLEDGWRKGNDQFRIITNCVAGNNDNYDGNNAR